MYKHKTKAFTLVELIVVITILAILGTIAFISLQGYSRDARDSTRISDLSSMKTSLELFQLDAGKYPQPSEYVSITYSGGTIWNQGLFGETVKANISKLDKIPTDPLTDKKYTYSVLALGNQYELGGIVEDTNSLAGSFGIAYAGNLDATAYITGNYNEQLAKVLSGTICNILALPSIITNDINTTDIQQILNNKNLVFRGYKNLPGSFKGSKFKIDGGFDFTPNNLLAYNDNQSCSPITDKTNYSARITLLQGLQDAYSGTILKNVGEIKNITSLNIDLNNIDNSLVTFADNLVNSTLSSKIIPGDLKVTNTVCSTNFTWSGTGCVDLDSPTGGSFTINGGATATTSTSVTLNVTCPSDAAGSNPIQVAFGNITGPSNWTTCTNSISHTLTSGYATKTVYLKFRDSAGNETSELTNNINLTSVITCTAGNIYNGTTCIPYTCNNGAIVKAYGKIGTTEYFVCYGQRTANLVQSNIITSCLSENGWNNDKFYGVSSSTNYGAIRYEINNVTTQCTNCSGAVPSYTRYYCSNGLCSTTSTGTTTTESMSSGANGVTFCSLSIDSYVPTSYTGIIGKDLYVLNGSRWRLRMENLFGLTSTQTTIDQYQTVWARSYNSSTESFPSWNNKIWIEYR
ncbi:MAG: type II secretion system protein [Candidatus Gracilibacteria bacterium]|nr:type II secretion system protein [Candidatus Gracilibacteria bacterium]